MMLFLAQGGIDEAVQGLIDRDTIIPVLAIVLGFIIAALCIITSTAKGMADTRSREKTRSEIAAYVAEGTMTAEEGERLLKAEPNALIDGVKSCCGIGFKGKDRSGSPSA